VGSAGGRGEVKVALGALASRQGSVTAPPAEQPAVGVGLAARRVGQPLLGGAGRVARRVGGRRRLPFRRGLHVFDLRI
jgi:hypothetical protein